MAVAVVVTAHDDTGMKTVTAPRTLTYGLDGQDREVEAVNVYGRVHGRQILREGGAGAEHGGVRARRAHQPLGTKTETVNGGAGAGAEVMMPDGQGREVGAVNKYGRVCGRQVVRERGAKKEHAEVAVVAVVAVRVAGVDTMAERGVGVTVAVVAVTKVMVMVAVATVKVEGVGVEMELDVEEMVVGVVAVVVCPHL